MSYQRFRIVDGKILEEDEETFLEREKKALEGILMPKSYICDLCNTICAFTDDGLYNHYKACHSHSDETDDEEEKNSEIGNSVQESPSELSPMVESIVPAEEDTCGKTIVSTKLSKPQDVHDSGYYPKIPKDVFIVSLNLIHQEMDFKVSHSPSKEFPQEYHCVSDGKCEASEEKPAESCDLIENRPTLEAFAFETSENMESDNWGPMPELSPQWIPSCSIPIQLDDDDDDVVTTEENYGHDEFEISRPSERELSGSNEVSHEKRKSNSPDGEHNFKLYDFPKKRRKVQAVKTVQCNLYDAMRRGERLWWCKCCDDYLKSIEQLKFHIAKVHNEDMSRVNRFNYATWDLEIARTFTKPSEIESQADLDLLEPATHVEQAPN